MTQLIECPACSSHNEYAVEQWPTGKRARAMACRDCGLLFAYFPPGRGARNAQDAANDGLEEAIWASGERNTWATKKGAALALLAALDRHFPATRPPAGARVLSIGPGTHAWLNAFRDRGWETFGIGRATDAASGRYQLLADLPTDPRFDLVIAYHVLERMPRPLAALRALTRALRLGGHCFVSVPRLDTLAVHRDTAYCLRPGKHVAAFTELCLRGLLARAGLETMAAFHDLDDAFTSGQPLRLRVLARKVDAAAPESNPAAALERVLQALAALDVAPKRQATISIVPDPTACPACAGANVQLVAEWRLPGNQARAAACGDCGLLFVHPQPSREALDAYYTPEGGWRASRTDRCAEAGLPHNRTEGAAATLLPALDPFFPATRPVAGARVFDFGCGPGAWLNSFQDRGWNTFGLEPSTDAAFLRHKRLLTVPSGPEFDLVIVYHVLEHLTRPLETLRELAGALLPGGYCLVSVPRLDTLAVHRQVDYCLHPRHHVVGFTEACLRGLLARAGLEVVETFHGLESAYSKGLPVRLQLLARKAARPPAIEPADAASALRQVIAAFVALRAPRRSPSLSHPRAVNA